MPMIRKAMLSLAVRVALGFAVIPVAVCFPTTITYAQDTGTVAENVINDLSRDLGVDRGVAVAIAANLAHESGGFRIMQEINPLAHSGEGGYGWAQWTGSRRTEYFNYARENGLNVNSYDANYGFLLTELTGSYAYVIDNMRNAGSIEEATQIFMDQFERPNAAYAHLDARIAYAMAFGGGDFSGMGMGGPGMGGGGDTDAIERPNIMLMPWGGRATA